MHPHLGFYTLLLLPVYGQQDETDFDTANNVCIVYRRYIYLEEFISKKKHRDCRIISRQKQHIIRLMINTDAAPLMKR